MKNKIRGDNVDDLQLLEGIKDKKAPCYEILIDRYIRYVTVVVSSVSKNNLSTQDIEEISADVFIKIWTNAEKISLKGETLKPYIAKMARNMTINKIRKISNGEILPLDEDIISTSDATPAERVISLQNTQIINESINGLDEPDREIFIRRYFYLEKIAEIAGKLGINENTVATKLARSKKRLKDLLFERGVVYE